MTSGYNNRYKQNITYLENKNKPDLCNSLLCGFTDTEGCFTCSIRDDTNQKTEA
jgi:hypothetical protein